jgi:hypothetical protein
MSIYRVTTKYGYAEFRTYQAANTFAERYGSAVEGINTDGALRLPPTDYEACGECGYDHGYEPREASAWHLSEDCEDPQ